MEERAATRSTLAVLAATWTGVLAVTWAWPVADIATWFLAYVWYAVSFVIWAVALVLTVVVVRKTWHRWSAVALAIALVVGTASLIGVRLDPTAFHRDERAWFGKHRSDFDEALGWAGSGCCSDYYGPRMPRHLQYLTINGRVSGGQGGVFFPQWIGIPDDAGGFWHVAAGSPEGFDMYGMICTDPVDLGDGWWMCGLRAG